MTALDQLRDQWPFVGLDDQTLARLADSASSQTWNAGQTLIQAGQADAPLIVLTQGQVVVRLPAGLEMARLGPGSPVGELSVLNGGPAMADVAAITDGAGLVIARADVGVILDVATVRERLERVAQRRLATNRLEFAEPIAVACVGGDVMIRPLWPDDWRALDASRERTSPESLRKRFFTVPKMHETFLRRLTQVDYVDQFAWALFDDDGVAGVGRYARLPHLASAGSIDQAELALLVADDRQGQGLGKLLVAALAVAATEHHLQTFTATALSENRAVQGLLTRFGAIWEPGSRGPETNATWPVADALAAARSITDLAPLQVAAATVLGPAQ